MQKAAFFVDEVPADAGEIALVCRSGSLAIGRQTRKINGTAKGQRKGKHAALSSSELAERAAERRRRRHEREEEKETLRDAARMRRARKRAELEEEQAGRSRRRIKARLEERDRPKVTAAGGRNLYRRYQNVEKVMFPGLGGATHKELSSLVFRIKSRSLGGEDWSRWRRGEAARTGRYYVRAVALEGDAAAAIHTNMVPADVERGSDDFVQRLTGFLRSYEQLEAAADPEGMVYKSGMVPLPYEVGSRGRRAIARRLCRILDKRGIPYLIVIHKPDAHGDQRNYHLHMMVLLREFEHVADWEWAFAATKSRDLFHPAMTRAWRRMLVASFNAELAAVRSERRYTLKPAADPEEHRGRFKTEVLREARCKDVNATIEKLGKEIASASDLAAAAGYLAEKIQMVQPVLQQARSAWAEAKRIIEERIALASARSLLNEYAERAANRKDATISAVRVARRHEERASIEAAVSYLLEISQSTRMSVRLATAGASEELGKARRRLIAIGAEASAILRGAGSAVVIAAHVQRRTELSAMHDRLTEWRDRSIETRITVAGAVDAVRAFAVPESRKAHPITSAIREASDSVSPRTSVRGVGYDMAKDEIERRRASISSASHPSEPEIAEVGTRRATEGAKAGVTTRLSGAVANLLTRVQAGATSIKKVVRRPAVTPGVAGLRRSTDEVAWQSDLGLRRVSQVGEKSIDEAEVSVASFDRAVGLLAETVRDAMERELAFLRIAIREKRVGRSARDPEILEAIDEEARQLLERVALRPVGAELLRSIDLEHLDPYGASQWAVPISRTRPIAMSSTGLLPQALARRLSPPILRHDLCFPLLEKAYLAGGPDRTAVAVLVDALDGNRDFQVALHVVKTETGESEIYIAAAGATLINALQDLTETEAGARLLVKLSRDDMLGGYEPEAHWFALAKRLWGLPQDQAFAEALDQPASRSGSLQVGLERSQSLERVDEADREPLSPKPDSPLHHDALEEDHSERDRRWLADRAQRDRP